MHRVIRTQELSDDHCQYFIYQVALNMHPCLLAAYLPLLQTLRALKALHSANVLHRDLKPSNLLLNANCDLKVCLFRAHQAPRQPLTIHPCLALRFRSRQVRPTSPRRRKRCPDLYDRSDLSQILLPFFLPIHYLVLAEYVATRWYRAPEVMLTFKEYTRAIDMWSVGCVLAEMLSGKPLFPGRDYHHQLSIILDVLGTPSLDDFYAISSHRSREYIRALPFRKKKPFATLFPTANPLAIDLLEQLLTFSPKNRIDVEGALAHPYLEVRCSSPI